MSKSVDAYTEHQDSVAPLVQSRAYKSGLSRPGAVQMISAAGLLALESIGPLMVAVAHPDREWTMILTGFPALGMLAASVALLVLYFIGFLRYGASKGYSKWLGFWLFLGNIPGLITLLILPQR